MISIEFDLSNWIGVLETVVEREWASETGLGVREVRGRDEHIAALTLTDTSKSLVAFRRR